jgi:hypothetical protein
MGSEPLQPFSPPDFLSTWNVPAAGILLPILLYGALFLWVVYTVVGIYHWYRYSHGSWVAFPAIGVHLFISLALIGYILTTHLTVL